jgi:glucosyl-dolichyl phosphate glucuronosyltransferase
VTSRSPLVGRQSASVSIVIPTFNRAALLGETLDSLARLQPRSIQDWEVLVVDNNSTDGTAVVVRRRQTAFPVPLRYEFEAAQGRSNALNRGIAATSAPVLAFIDDDVVVAERWLDAAAGLLLDPDSGVDYTGGPVHPIWEAPRPRWMSATKADLWGAIAILDYGAEPFEFEERRRVPLGANMAVRRTLVDRIGGFSPLLGRSSGTQILGQEVPEFLARARAINSRGRYVPAMIVRHHVPARRLTKAYFRRWWYGKGRSRAALERLQPITELGVDLNRVPHVLRTPRFMWRTAAEALVGWAVAALRLDREDQFKHEAMLCYFAGYALARREEGSAGFVASHGSSSSTVSPKTAHIRSGQ